MSVVVPLIGTVSRFIGIGVAGETAAIAGIAAAGGVAGNLREASGRNRHAGSAMVMDSRNIETMIQGDFERLASYDATNTIPNVINTLEDASIISGRNNLIQSIEWNAETYLERGGDPSTYSRIMSNLNMVRNGFRIDTMEQVPARTPGPPNPDMIAEGVMETLIGGGLGGGIGYIGVTEYYNIGDDDTSDGPPRGGRKRGVQPDQEMGPEDGAGDRQAARRIYFRNKGANEKKTLAKNLSDATTIADNPQPQDDDAPLDEGVVMGEELYLSYNSHYNQIIRLIEEPIPKIEWITV